MRNFRGSVKHIFAALLFCLVLSMTMVCLADEKGTVKVESAKIRETADTTSKQLGSVAKGGTVDIIGETTGTDGKKWYQVYVNANTKGYIRADLIDRSGSGSLPTVNAPANTGGENAAGNTGDSTLAVTPTQARAATVVKNGVRVRKSASTDSTEVATVSRGIVVAVTGETTGTDNQKWFQVTFKHSDKDINGFIRSDLITFDNVPDDPAISEITGAENSEGQPQTEPETQPQEEEPKQEDNSGADEYAGVIYMNVDEEPYVMPGFELVSLDWNNQKIKAYRNGTFFILYAQKQNGEEGWYLFDRELNAYQRYPYTAENATVPNEMALSGNLVPIIAMGVVIVIMAAVILILFVKLKGNSDYYEEYEEDDDYPDEDDDIDDLEELDDIKDAPSPARRPAPQGPGRQPVRRPEQQGNQQPARRPASQGPNGHPQGPNGQPPRRPAPQGPGGAPQGPNGQPPRRPTPQGSMPQGNNGQPPRRPASQGPNGHPQGQRRPNPQNNRPPQNMQQQRGQKAKSMLTNDEDDMDFIDI